MESINPNRLTLLNTGQAECKTLTELVSVDFNSLLQSCFPHLLQFNIPSHLGITKRMALAGQALYKSTSLEEIAKLRKHTSDLVRGWACYALAYADLQLEECLEWIKPFADDANPGVREWAWIALRPKIAADFPQAISLLKPWTQLDAENLRRFASEITRPRGVWCAHIQALKDSPWLGVAILEPLKADTSRYVQKSVANWLNDAGKTQPEWVKELCSVWLSQSDNPHTRYIYKRALRNLNNQ